MSFAKTPQEGGLVTRWFRESQFDPFSVFEFPFLGWLTGEGLAVSKPRFPRGKMRVGAGPHGISAYLHSTPFVAVMQATNLRNLHHLSLPIFSSNLK